MESSAQISVRNPLGDARLLIETTALGKPSEAEKMARRRCQTLKPEPKGNFWWVRMRVDVFVEGVRTRRQERVKLGAISKMSYRDAQRAAKEHEVRLNQGLVIAGSGVTFSEFVETIFESITLPLLASTTQTSYCCTIKKYLMPVFADTCLGMMTHMNLQRYFSGLARHGLHHDTVLKVRDALSCIMRAAEQYEFISKNPMEGLKLPPDKTSRKGKPYITPDQFKKLVELLPEPYATMIYVAIWTGLRVSELAALKWRNVHDNTITVEERYSRGDWAKPKTKSSAATIGIEPHVVARILLLKTLTVDVRAGRAVRRYRVVKRDGPDDLVFQSVKDGKPMQDGNVLRRYIKPAGRALGIPFVNWQCLRTSHATWLVQAGADPKSVQGQMRHSRISTTMDIYAQTVPEAQRHALRRLSEFAYRRTELVAAVQ
jgi:integrase